MRSRSAFVIPDMMDNDARRAATESSFAAPRSAPRRSSDKENKMPKLGVGKQRAPKQQTSSNGTICAKIPKALAALSVPLDGVENQAVNIDPPLRVEPASTKMIYNKVQHDSVVSRGPISPTYSEAVKRHVQHRFRTDMYARRESSPLSTELTSKPTLKDRGVVDAEDIPHFSRQIDSKCESSDV
mmetsp:Transcript_25702/g.70823  ORF Transcript_25702/g.70823 Transcript_25702/m.70823 type:complete len:185 (+) Transcript_25702:113-667(+)